MRGFMVVACLCVSLTAALFAQDTTSQPDSAAPTLAPPPPTPTPAQTRYLAGLRSASRGVAQLKDGVDRVLRSLARPDSVRVKQAGSRLAGLCGAARGFMANGRAQMQAIAYEDSARIKARALTMQVDSLLRYVPTCEARAARAPGRTANELLDRLRAYDVSAREFREATGIGSRQATPQ